MTRYVLKYLEEEMYIRPVDKAVVRLAEEWADSDHIIGYRLIINEKETDVALPACHVYYQFCVNNGRLDMMMVQRSCDMFLGVPFNIASGAALLTLIAHHAGYTPGKLHWVGNCCHLYENHIEQAETLIKREPYKFPYLCVYFKDDIGDYTKSDFELIDYQSHDRIVAPLSVGV